MNKLSDGEKGMIIRTIIISVGILATDITIFKRYN